MTSHYARCVVHAQRGGFRVLSPVEDFLGVGEQQKTPPTLVECVKGGHRFKVDYDTYRGVHRHWETGDTLHYDCYECRGPSRPVDDEILHSYDANEMIEAWQREKGYSDLLLIVARARPNVYGQVSHLYDNCVRRCMADVMDYDPPNYIDFSMFCLSHACYLRGLLLLSYGMNMELSTVFRCSCGTINVISRLYVVNDYHSEPHAPCFCAAKRALPVEY